MPQSPDRLDTTPPPELVAALRALASGTSSGQGAPSRADATEDTAKNVDLTFGFDGGGASVIIGTHVYLKVDFPCRISGWSIVADSAGSISFDLNSGAFAVFPTLTPMVGEGGTTPHTTASESGEGLVADLVGWTLTVGRASVLEAVVSANDDVIQVCSLSLRAKRLDL